MKIGVPHASWEPIYFRMINTVADLTGQGNLRATRLPPGDLEVRIWWGFGLSPLEGVTLRRSGSQWTAIHVKADDYSEPSRAERRQLSTPKSGWDTLWTRLINEKILSLPDASEVNCDVGGLDGISTVIETNTDNAYRTYRYDMPAVAKCNEDKNISAMADIIFEEFSLGVVGASAEEYAAWSAVIANMFAGERITFDSQAKIKQLVIGDETTVDHTATSDPDKEEQEFKQMFPMMAAEVAKDYRVKNRTPVRLKDSFQLSMKHVLIEKEELDRMFKSRDEWGEFYKKYPDSGGFIRLSRVGFNSAMNQALVYVEHGCGGLCGTGHYVLLEKNVDGWRVVQSSMAWIS